MRPGDNRGMTEVESVDSTNDAKVVIELDGTSHRLPWPRDETLVDLMLGAGINVPHSCREGHCGSCVATVISGQVQMAHCDILEPNDLAEGLILGCQARPISDDVHVEF